MRNLLTKLLNLFRKKSASVDSSKDGKVKGTIKYSLVRPEKIKNVLVPKVKGYSLEDLFVAKIIRVDHIDGEDDEFEDFDYNTLSGETPPPIAKEDYHTSTVERFVILRPSLYPDEEKEYYDIFTGFGYDTFDFASEVGEEYIDRVASLQTWFKYYLRTNNVKVFPAVSYVDIINMKNTVNRYMADIDKMEESGLIVNSNNFLEECPSFEHLFKAWYVTLKCQIKSL